TDVIAILKSTTSPNDAAMKAIRKALAALIGNAEGDAFNGALDMLAKGNFNGALVKLEEAIRYLEIAEAADATLNFTKLKSVLTLTAKSVAVDAVARAEAAGKKVEAAKAAIVQGQTYLGAKNYIGAVRAFRSAL
ncbi:MAG: hypothetical protein ACLGH0_01520, partial [Thermoanaerobaculia bacterium]